MNAAHPIGGSPLYASGLTGGGEQFRLRSLGCDSNGRPEGGSGRTPARAAMDCRDPLGAWLAGADLLRSHATIARDHRASQFAFNASREPFELLAIDDIPRQQQSQVTGLSHFNRKRVQELLADEPRLIHSISTDAELAIEACGHTGNRDIIRMHLDQGAPLSLPTAISVGDLDHARWLLEQDSRLIHERGPHDFAVMWYPAIGGGSVEAAELLLSHGAALEQESGVETALHLAAMRGHLELIRFLVEQGADIEAIGYRQDRAGRTPLQLALARNREDAARLLRELGALG